MKNTSICEIFIPTPFISNHASNIIPLKNGDILCAWFAGSKEGNPDVYIVMSRLKKNSIDWSEPVILSEDHTRSEQNPVLFPSPDGRLWLLYTAQDKYQDTALIRYRISEDNGYTWSEIKTLFDAPGSFIRQPIVVLDNGDWLLPMYYSLKSDKNSWYGNDYSAVMISSDYGKNWTEHEVPDSTGLVHMNVNILSDGSLAGYFRSRWADRIYKSKSWDQGRTWSKPFPTQIPNNNSSFQCTRLTNGNMVMVFNNTFSKKYATESGTPPWMGEDENNAVRENKGIARSAVWGTPRIPLTVAMSEDEGETWPYIRDLEYIETPLPDHSLNEERKKEYSYPSVKQTQDGKIHITYTFLRKSIKYVCITEGWIREGVKSND